MADSCPHTNMHLLDSAIVTLITYNAMKTTLPFFIPSIPAISSAILTINIYSSMLRDLFIFKNLVSIVFKLQYQIYEQTGA